jgi:ABC-2 type transport system permease protein
MTLLTIAHFEAAQRLRRISTWVYFGLFLALAFFFFVAAAGAFEKVSLGFGTGGKVMANSPHTLANIVGTISFFGLLIFAAVTGPAVQQDFQHASYALIFTAPISKTAYLLGRFVGALAVLLLIQLAPVLGCVLGSFMPFVDAKLMGPQQPMAFVAPYLILALPTAISMGAIFFAIGALTRRTRAVFTTGVIVLVGSLIAGAVSSKIENKLLADLIDPFGSDAFSHLTEYWTIAEKNSRIIPLAGVLLANRLLWLAIGAGALVITHLRFAMAAPLERAGRKPTPAPDLESPVSTTSSVSPGAAHQPPAPPHPLRHLPRLTFLAFRETVRNVPFILIVLTGLTLVVVTIRMAGAVFGTETYPVTAKMIELGAGSFGIFLLTVITIHTGDLAWRERDARFDQIVDALPVPGWLLYCAKLGALLLVGVLLELLVMATGIGVQIASGYHRFQLGLYLGDLLGLRLISYFQIAVLALFLQTVVNHKHLAQFAMVLYFVVQIVLPLAGFEHNLYRYGGDPNYVYSDMNGYGHFLGPWAWFNLYWTLFAVALALVSARLWPRGHETRLRLRARVAFSNWRGPSKWALWTVLLGFVATGVFIFINTNVINRYRTSADGKRLRVEYERRFKRHEHEPQPRITAVQVHFDLRPESRTLHVKGRFALENRSGAPIARIYVNLPETAEVHRLAFAGVERPSDTYPEPRFYTFTLPTPLAPGATTAADFDLTYAPHGFGNGGAEGEVMGNGSFISNAVLPTLGYLPGVELGDDGERRKRGLPPKARMADLDDPAARQRNYLSDDADRLTLTASACTSPDQLVVLPGRLERQWQEGGRNCVAYAPERPILDLYAVLSARYAVKRDQWKDVALEIDYQPGHEYNLTRMLDAMKAALDYCSTHFAPYQSKQLRIVEFPRYRQFAQSLPNIIPYSESIGFIAKVNPKSEDDVDYPYYITAHEVAHQWWGHQVVGADVQGATLLSESLAQYSALMVMKATFGPAQMKRFLRYELDHYLRSRALERKKELPLLRVENQQYIHYNKASLVFYALQDAIGERTVNQALRTLIETQAFRGPPYATARDLLAALAAVTPPDRRALLTDLFETITLYENRALAAQARPLAGGKWEVTVRVTAKKLRADELGAESEVPFNEPIDVGVLGEDGKLLATQKVVMGPGEHTTVLVVSALPKRAGIDPTCLLIDRQPDDNLTSVDVAAAK